MVICQVRGACDPHRPIRGLPWDFIYGLQERALFFCWSFQLEWCKSRDYIIWEQTSLLLFPFVTGMYEYIKVSRVWGWEEEKLAKRVREKWRANSGRKREALQSSTCCNQFLLPLLIKPQLLCLCHSLSLYLQALTSNSPSETIWLVILDLAGPGTTS